MMVICICIVNEVVVGEAGTYTCGHTPRARQALPASALQLDKAGGGVCRLLSTNKSRNRSISGAGWLCYVPGSIS